MNNPYKDLFILDLANNHFGDESHAKKIIKKFSDISKKKKIKSAIKFQLRDYGTFIHKDFFEGFSKVINLQLYVSENIPLEAGTCFWEHTGTDLLSDTISNKGAVATWPYDNWKLIEQ